MKGKALTLTRLPTRLEIATDFSRNWFTAFTAIPMRVDHIRDATQMVSIPPYSMELKICVDYKHVVARLEKVLKKIWDWYTQVKKSYMENLGLGEWAPLPDCRSSATPHPLPMRYPCPYGGGYKFVAANDSYLQLIDGNDSHL